MFFKFLNGAPHVFQINPMVVQPNLTLISAILGLRLKKMVLSSIYFITFKMLIFKRGPFKMLIFKKGDGGGGIWSILKKSSSMQKPDFLNCDF